MVGFIIYKLRFKPRGNSSHEKMWAITSLFAAVKHTVQRELRTKLTEAEALELGHSHDNRPTWQPALSRALKVWINSE